MLFRSGLELLKKSKGRVLLGFILPVAENLKEKLNNVKEVDDLKIAGSYRRRKETVGDLDILVTSEDPKKVMDEFVNLDNVEETISKGKTKSSVRIEEGLQVDLRAVKKKSFGSALLYFTGSKEHNIALRQVAQKQNMKLSEYGLFKNGNFKAGRTEKSVYKKLGLSFIPPELRENRGEVEASQKNNIPDLVNKRDIRGDLQMHSKYSDGKNSIKDMVGKAKNLGYDYIAITDHVGSLQIANAMDNKTIKKQWTEIDKLNKGNFKIFKGAEVDIKGDGLLYIDDEIIKKLDIVLVSIHHKFKMNEKNMTERICKALENKYVNIFAHPLTRMIGKREPIDADWEKIFECAKDNNVALEINSYPNRLDLPDTYVKKAKEMGCKIAINTVSHSTEHLKHLNLPVSTARRGWVEKQHAINTKTSKQLEKFLTN